MAWEAPDTWIWPDDFAAYAEGRLDAHKPTLRCASTGRAAAQRSALPGTSP
jgi:hypothetical protein